MSRVILCVLFAAASGMAQADPAALARETAQHMQNTESLLRAAIKKGERAAFDRFILAPTETLQARWPGLADTRYDKYRRCQFALMAFKQYALDTFAARAPLPEAAPTRKDYKNQLALCLKSLPK